MLPIGNYKLTFVAKDRGAIREHSGSAWRGLFGHSLKNTFCVTGQKECEHCLLYHSCGYVYLFETPPPPDTEKMRKYTSVPRPFIILPLQKENKVLEPGDRFQVGFRLFGGANRFLPHVIHSWRVAAKSGIGQRVHRSELTAVEQESEPGSGNWSTAFQSGNPFRHIPPVPPKTPGIPDSIRVILDSPLALRRKGCIVNPESFSFSDLFSSLLRRVSMLSYFHDEQSLEVDFSALTRQSKSIELIHPHLYWEKWMRYSSRQKKTLCMRGIKGTFTLDPGQIADFWPFLWVGQWTGTGKSTVMGQGQYRISPVSLEDYQNSIVSDRIGAG